MQREADALQRETAYNQRTEQLKKESEEGGVVARNRAKVQLDAHLAEDPLPLRKAKITLEAANKKAERVRAPFQAATEVAAAARAKAETSREEAEAARKQAEVESTRCSYPSKQKLLEYHFQVTSLKVMGGINKRN